MRDIDPFDCAFDDFPASSDASNAAAVETHVEEEAIVASGRAEGREAGLKEGFKEGRLLGQKTGVEYGMEVGFATGLLEAVREAIVEDRIPEKSLERIAKSANDLEKAIDDFPSSQESIRNLFRYKSIHNNEDENDDEQRRSHNEEEEHIRAKLQRIRARSKVLAAKLGIPHHSLKTVLAEASRNKAVANSASSNSETPLENAAGDQDW